MSLAGRRVVLGVSGGIAAYKAAYLARRFIEKGATVRVVMTQTATEFVGAATFAGLTGYAPVTALTDHPESVSPHTDLGRWADLVVVAPATAATLARIAGGLSEDALSATVIASEAPLVVAPAMHTEMWQHPATQRSIATLVADGVHVVGPVSGALAGGDEGSGRMVEPEDIVARVEDVLAGGMSGVKVLVTAGGTREPIDPVRYIGNRSSGKMGHEIADEAARRGADVTLVTTSGLPSHHGVTRVDVDTAESMASAVAAVEADVAVMAAAVADFRPASPVAAKLSRTEGPPDIVLEATPDILSTVVARSKRPYLVGFAAETGSLDRAIEKARVKGVDLLVANDITREGAGFGTDTNIVSIVEPDGGLDHWPLMTKADIARRLWDLVEARRQ